MTIAYYIPVVSAIQFDGSNIEDVVSALNSAEYSTVFESVTPSSYVDYDPVFGSYGPERPLNVGEWVQIGIRSYDYGHIPDAALNDPTKFFLVEQPPAP